MSMPALPNVPGVIRTHIILGDETQGQAGSRFFIQYTGGPPSSADMVALATSVSAAFGSHLAPLYASPNAVGDITCEDLSSSTGAVGTFASSVTGSRSGTELPANCTAQIAFQISRRYRGGKPRIYLPLGVEGDLNDKASWDNTFIGLVNAGWSAFMVEILATSGLGISLVNHVNVSYYSGPNTSTPPWRGPGFKYPPKLRTTPVIDQIVSHSLSPKIGSQRRRLSSL